MQNNVVHLSGQIASELEFSHEIMDEKFYDFTIAVQRLSGQKDFVPVTVSERIIGENNFEIGNLIGLIGQFRSYNKSLKTTASLCLKCLCASFATMTSNFPIPSR